MKSLLLMGFKESAKEMAEQYVRDQNVIRKEKKEPLLLAPDYVVDPETIECRVPCGQYRQFQLKHCGHLMVRNVDSRPDPRVTGFYPDAWQRKLLDVVDQRQSVLVVAPTSSGKTFVSFYAMRDMLIKNKTLKKQ